ncbi:hypothetical protein J8J27_32315, partial [Mycobacterium tuberculosis]|nr:hypothetical protein [Mycobacterium tuberculosis]
LGISRAIGARKRCNTLKRRIFYRREDALGRQVGCGGTVRPAAARGFEAAGGNQERARERPDIRRLSYED